MFVELHSAYQSAEEMRPSFHDSYCPKEHLLQMTPKDRLNQFEKAESKMQTCTEVCDWLSLGLSGDQALRMMARNGLTHYALEWRFRSSTSTGNDGDKDDERKLPAIESVCNDDGNEGDDDDERKPSAIDHAGDKGDEREQSGNDAAGTRDDNAAVGSTDGKEDDDDDAVAKDDKEWKAAASAAFAESNDASFVDAHEKSGEEIPETNANETPVVIVDDGVTKVASVPAQKPTPKDSARASPRKPPPKDLSRASSKAPPAGKTKTKKVQKKAGKVPKKKSNATEEKKRKSASREKDKTEVETPRQTKRQKKNPINVKAALQKATLEETCGALLEGDGDSTSENEFDDEPKQASPPLTRQAEKKLAQETKKRKKSKKKNGK